jgi:hypothetical protein
MDCQNLVFSPKQSKKRIEKAMRVLPSIILRKIIFFSLYLLGARIKTIASLVDIPEVSGKTTIHRVMKDGISAFIDRRQSPKSYVEHIPQQTQQQVFQASVLLEDEYCIILFGDSKHQLKIPLSHRVHLKSVLLSLLLTNMLPINKVSSVLGITIAHCRKLAIRLKNEDVAEVLIDKRQGQKNDYLVDQNVKAELIQHFVSRTITGHSTSSNKLSEVINNNTDPTNISSRTIRWHINKMGLVKIKKTLPELIQALKKKS